MKERLESHRDLNKIIRSLQGNTVAVQELVYRSPWSIIRVPESQAYLTAQERNRAALYILDNLDNQWIRHTHNLRHLVPDDELRSRIIRKGDAKK